MFKLSRGLGVCCLAVLCLVSGSGAWAAEQAPAAGNEPGAQAAAALSAGRRAKGEGDLARAETHFQDALAGAERGSDLYAAALEELTYHLPLMRVERHVMTQQWSKAERLLQDLLQRHQSDEKKSQHLVRLIAQLRDQAPVEGGVYTDPGSGRRAVRHVKRKLERFREDNGRYPRSYDELNHILPAGRYPLTDYDIVHYVGRGRAYGLTLRSKSDPDNLLSVQKTGIVE